MKINHKLTTQIIKHIEALEKSLPQLQKNEGCKPMFRAVSKRVLGSEIPVEERVKINGFKSYQSYIQRGQQAVLTNHKINLIEAFKKDGQDGIMTYLNDVKHVMEYHKSKQDELKVA